MIEGTSVVKAFLGFLKNSKTHMASFLFSYFFVLIRKKDIRAFQDITKLEFILAFAATYCAFFLINSLLVHLWQKITVAVELKLQEQEKRKRRQKLLVEFERKLTNLHACERLIMTQFLLLKTKFITISSRDVEPDYIYELIKNGFLEEAPTVSQSDIEFYEGTQRYRCRISDHTWDYLTMNNCANAKKLNLID